MNRKYPRAQWHDYNSGIYFVTVCTHNRFHYFGEIRNGEITHTEIGAYLCRAIEQLSQHYPYVSIARYVVMPNHFHAIIPVHPAVYTHAASVGSRHAAASSAPAVPVVPVVPANPPLNMGCLRPPHHPEQDDDFNARSHFNSLLSRAVGGLKSAVTKQAHLLNMEFRWQANFHDHIIRNQREYDLIAQYIDNNISSWGKDRFYSTK